MFQTMWKLNELDFVKEEVRKINGFNSKPGKIESIRGFIDRTKYAFRLILLEKEIIMFALLQWVAIAFGYYLWVQMLGWIPPEVWKSASESKHSSGVDLILVLWSFVCVGIVALPLGLLSACIGVVPFLNKQGKESTVATCLKIVIPRAWTLWIFHWIDGWITVNMILDRLPKKNDRRSAAEKALEEALYYAWKIGTSGILPSIINGNNLINAGKESVLFLKSKFMEIVKLRIGCSVLSWIIGIVTYIGTIYLFATFHLIPKDNQAVYSHVFEFYCWVGLPLLIAVAIIELIIRPVMIISLCDIYSDYVKENNIKINLPESPPKLASAFIFFFILLLLVAIVFLYRYQLGIMNILITPYK